MVQLLDDLTKKQMLILEEALQTLMNETSHKMVSAIESKEVVDSAQKIADAAGLQDLIRDYRKIKYGE